MLIETPGGFDYTGADCVGWMKEAGFRETRVEHLVGPGLDGRRHQVGQCGGTNPLVPPIFRFVTILRTFPLAFA